MNMKPSRPKQKSRRPVREHLIAPNARFWYWHGPAAGGGYDGWVKITLQPGEKRCWEHHYQHDEGFGANYVEFDYDSDDSDDALVCVRETSIMSDCDGRHVNEIDLTCEVDRLQGHLLEVLADNGRDTKCVIRRPTWRKRSESQRDAFAEAAGY